jgi:hypothetical protein
MREVRNKAATERIGYERKQNRNCLVSWARVWRSRAVVTPKTALGRISTSSFCQRPHPIRITGGPVKLDPEIATFRATQLGERTPGKLRAKAAQPDHSPQLPIITPIIASAETAACASSGQVAAPPKMAMNSRHLT